MGVCGGGSLASKHKVSWSTFFFLLSFKELVRVFSPLSNNSWDQVATEVTSAGPLSIHFWIDFLMDSSSSLVSSWTFLWYSMIALQTFYSALIQTFCMVAARQIKKLNLLLDT